MKLLFRCTIPDRVGIKKNRQQMSVNKRTGAHFPRPSSEYIAWAEMAEVYVRQAWRNRPTITVPIIVKFSFYFEDKRGKPDISNAYQGPEDVLQKCGVIFNDSLIEGHDGSRRYFGHEARTEIEIYAMEEK